MKQLTMGTLIDIINELSKRYNKEEFRAMPIYIGDDDELNGIHCAWYTQVIDADKTDDEYEMGFVELINENSCNYKLENGKAILIS